MDIVIDANVFADFFKVSVLNADSTLTENPLPIFDNLGNAFIACIDEGNQIESEWRNIVDKEWFDAWLGDMLIGNKIRQISVGTHNNLLKKITSMGFPRSRDAWYVRTSKEVSVTQGDTTLITEDIDFYDPKKKGCPSKTRLNIITKGAGNIATFLRKKENITVMCVTNFVT